MAKTLWKGNEAIGEAAIRAGVQAYFGYPITPQTELLEYMSRRMPEEGRVFLQAESELGAINMVYGAASVGARVMSSSSSPGISLMQEGLSYIAASLLPCVLVDIMRGGPGLGNIQPSQGDYNQLTKGGGHGDYHPIVLAPSSVQEAADLTVLAFDLADRYRHIVIIAGDGLIGQMMEPAEMPEFRPIRDIRTQAPDWALTGAQGRPKRVITSLYLQAEELEHVNQIIQEIEAEIRAKEQRWQELMVDDADYLVVAYGTVARIAQGAIRLAREKGLRVGLLRPITLWPFPYEAVARVAHRVQGVLVAEMSAGQMVDDVRLAVQSAAPLQFFGRLGGVVPMPEEIVEALESLAHGPARPAEVISPIGDRRG
jgi:2-oxoglutarate ferredoxin oxidoreductase subunit alpha